MNDSFDEEKHYLLQLFLGLCLIGLLIWASSGGENTTYIPPDGPCGYGNIPC